MKISVEAMAKELQKKGFKVKFYYRKEGGARISSINGKAYTGSKGNIEARALLGVDLSEKQKKHLKLIQTQKGQFGGRNPFKAKTAEVNKAFKEAVKAGRFNYKEDWRTGKKRKAPRVSYAKVQYRLKKEGSKAVEEYLEQALRYAKGYIYDGALETYVQRLKADNAKSKSKYVNKIIKAIDEIIARKLNMKETDFQELQSITYDWENNILNNKDFYLSATEILKRVE